ncbi:MAG: type 1 glutamine amidotransferase [Methanomicrobiales archaeon]|nr:type 1 glutamine amidotransferase [Methanomicrobiales archaeon]MDI6876058.1 type 1 glutamine amidotransferase [Methanomicrobiales archaeon]
MHVAIFQHAENEPGGIFDALLQEKGVPFEYIRLYESGEVPPLDATHLLFMGGPMSVNDEREYPYLAEEKACIRSAIAKGSPVLGICLGAQLIASALGGRVFGCREEIGWRTVRKASEGAFPGFPGKFKVFQLHGETFEVPPGGTLLCSGEQVQNQAFSIGSAIGLQFHLELTEALIEDWVRDLPGIERERIMADTDLHLARSNHLCRLLAGTFLNGHSGAGQVRMHPGI